MKKEIEQIRAILIQLENTSNNDDDLAFVKNFNALEVPEIVASVVDLLQPELVPYETAIYWYLFRHSILNTGQQYVRASVRGLMKGVTKSERGGSENLCYGTVQKCLNGLEQKGAIVKSGDTNREGTLYKVCLPDEILLCQERLKTMLPLEIIEINEDLELDYYNIRDNRLKIFERDVYICKYCNKQLTRFTATLDHIMPVSRGGDNSKSNLITACLHCNSQRGNNPVMEAIIKGGSKQNDA